MLLDYQQLNEEQKRKNLIKYYLEKVLYSVWFRFAFLLLLCASIGIGLPIVWTKVWKPSKVVTIEADLRYDCFPLKPTIKIKNTSCNQNVCIWDKFATDTDVQCYYQMENDKDIIDHKFYLPHYLVENETDPFNYLLSLKQQASFFKPNNSDLNQDPISEQYLSLSIKHFSEKHFSVLIKPTDEDEDLWSQHFDFNYGTFNNSLESDAVISVRNSWKPNLFNLKVERRSTGTVLFNMGTHTPFVFARGYREITTLLMNDLIYGLGQSNQNSFRHNFTNPKKWYLFNQYTNNITENTTSLFGSHPFYMGVDDAKAGNSFGILLLNSFPIEVTTNARPSITFRTFGGHFEFHFFLGPKPIDVHKQLLTFIHRPALPPYWALGFHFCRSRCSIPSLSQTISTFYKRDIPIESDCGTALKSDYQNLNSFMEFQNELARNDMKFLSVDYPHRFILDNSKQLHWSTNSLLDRESSKKHPYRGTLVRCNSQNDLSTFPAIYPDFFNTNSKKLYNNELFYFADGYILDYNTPVNFANGNNSCLSMSKRFPWNYYTWTRLNEKNPCLDSQFSQPLFDENSPSNEMGPYLGLHNLYGLKHAKVVSESFTTKRAFVMSLSTFIGSGHYGGHLGTPINGTWDMLKFVLKQTLDFSLFGVPLTGFPVGGFKGESRTDELIRRWYQLASVLPFMIAYSDFGEVDTALIDSVKETIRSSVKTRYQLLPYLYTLFYKAYSSGSLVVQPLFFEFQTDERTYDVGNQFMLGPALMVSPVLEEDVTEFNVYFPKGRWYDFYSGHLMSKKNGGIQQLSAVEQHVNMQIRGGYVIVLQEPLLTISQTRRKNGLDLIVAFDQMNHAKGELYLDDGNSVTPVKRFLWATINAEYTNITINLVDHNEFCRDQALLPTKMINTELSTVNLYGVIDQPYKGIVNIYKNDLLLRKLSNDDVFFENRFGVLSLQVNVDLCKSSSYFIEWAYSHW